MFEVTVEETFAAAHALRGYKGKCENVHGHNYRVRVTIAGKQLKSTGLLVDFVDVKHAMREAIEYLDHGFVNDLPPFDKLNPTAENMARYFFDEIRKALESRHASLEIRVAAVKIWETDTSTATYRPD